MNETLLNTKNIHKLIKYWRKEKENADGPSDRLIASCYIDAFQTVLNNHGLSQLPLPKEK